MISVSVSMPASSRRISARSLAKPTKYLSKGPPQGMIGVAPDLIGLQIPQIAINSPAVASSVCAPTSQIEIIPPAVPATSIGNHQGVTSVG